MLELDAVQSPLPQQGLQELPLLHSLPLEVLVLQQDRLLALALVLRLVLVLLMVLARLMGLPRHWEVTG